MRLSRNWLVSRIGTVYIELVRNVPLLLHDAWFYWAHRIEHRVPLLWEFHKLHHSDELMNASTFARDKFPATGLGAPQIPPVGRHSWRRQHPARQLSA